METKLVGILAQMHIPLDRILPKHPKTQWNE
jgi:hypothetical protein